MDAHQHAPDRELLLAKLEALTPWQQSEVHDFIDFLRTRTAADPPLVQHLQAQGANDVDLQDVRRRLANIPGTMSETVRALRDERG